ncbi:MAG: glycerate kinase [Clostridia bacterium]|nr:glycerate kinase [Clostridia bacterium]
MYKSIAIMIDSFKGSMSSTTANEAALEGFRRVFSDDPDVHYFLQPISDGGEGFFEALAYDRRNVTVSGPLGEPVDVCVGQCGRVAVIEMAQAAGLPLVPQDKRDPMHTTTYGVGEMIRHAIENGYRKFIIGIGGSATNDGGIGMLQALGFGLLDENGEPVPFGAKGLKVLKTITTDKVLPTLAECEFTVACDVENPLCGDNGCSAVFALQKGASAQDVAEMDRWLYDYAQLVKTVFPKADETAPGAGAAGGMGFALSAFLGATLKSGFDIIAEENRLERQIRLSDLVITGEGHLDGQSAMGKVPCKVATLAKQHGVPVIALVGGVAPDARVCHDVGITAVFPIVRGVTTLEEAMDEAAARRNMADTAEQVARLIKGIAENPMVTADE